MFLAPAGYLQDWPRPRGGQAQAYWWRAGGHTGHLSLQVDPWIIGYFGTPLTTSMADYSLWTTCPKYGTCIIYSVYSMYCFCLQYTLNYVRGIFHQLYTSWLTPWNQCEELIPIQIPLFILILFQSEFHYSFLKLLTNIKMMPFSALTLKCKIFKRIVKKSL